MMTMWLTVYLHQIPLEKYRKTIRVYGKLSPLIRYIHKKYNVSVKLLKKDYGSLAVESFKIPDLDIWPG